MEFLRMCKTVGEGMQHFGGASSCGSPRRLEMLGHWSLNATDSECATTLMPAPSAMAVAHCQPCWCLAAKGQCILRTTTFDLSA
eukprot:6012026-Amphidinium_carterae.1